MWKQIKYMVFIVGYFTGSNWVQYFLSLFPKVCKYLTPSLLGKIFCLNICYTWPSKDKVAWK